ncbi:hypothetical protein [Lysobacter niastensis]|uniref:DUF4175 domain-containing protein n=1 Tax=Lysobacter niastensis TaxID=380629 RepID=A0ABS0B5F2_9GAMM|nr:hypothetical protein [Lysobacter niastensis]MBF6024055.1 hypothetical protein [Lysobacter niastensis]
MNAASILRDTLRDARLRRGLDAALAGLPWAAMVGVAAWRFSGVIAAIIVVLVAVAAIAAFALHRARRLDHHWLVRELDARRPDMEDSADLLFAQAGSLLALPRLQLARLQQRIETARMPDLRPRWSAKAIATGFGVAAVAIAALLLWPARPPASFDEVVAAIGGTEAKPTQTRLLEQQLRIVPPAYTRLPAREEATLDAKAPQGTRLQWTLRFAPQPGAAELVYHDGRSVALTREGDVWHGSDVLTRSALYRIVLHDAPPLTPAVRHRLDAIADRPPTLRVIEPDRSLSLMKPGQRGWALTFEAGDDYGLAANARLRIMLAQGSGENITFREQTVAVRGSGGATQKRYVQRVDLSALGYAVGDDLIVQLRVEDNRSPSPQSANSASLILRWPPDLGNESTGLEGMVKKVMPAYFRSQRQIIIDAETLLKQKRKLDAAQYTERSDGIGVDQRILRLRYGQFLGEEAEGGPKPPPTSDEQGDTAHAEEGAAADADHDHAPAADSQAFGQETSVLEEYGHTHDHAEAATLLDPETRTTLKAALDQMWQSELNLRQGHPELALPYAYKALGFIKQVQQATRIYLARVGTELPPIDESRRMGGDRAGLARRDDALVAATAADPTLANLWRALDEAPAASAAGATDVDFAVLERWLREHPSQLADPLAFIAVMETLRADPACVPCRRELRALLWPLLPRPASTVPRRDDGGAAGRRYLDALREERAR